MGTSNRVAIYVHPLGGHGINWGLISKPAENYGKTFKTEKIAREVVSEENEK